MKAIQVIPGEFPDGGAILRDASPETRVAPSIHAMVSPFCLQDDAAARVLTSNPSGPSRDVGSILRENRPLGEIDPLGQGFGELDHTLGRLVQDGSLAALTFRRFLNLGISKAEQRRAVSAQKIKPLIAIHVHEAATFAGRSVIRETTRQATSGGEVTVDASRHHFRGSQKQLLRS